MPSNDELREACETVLWWDRTAVEDDRSAILDPAVLLARHVKSTLATEQAGEQAIDETALCSIGFAPRADAGFWIEGGWADVTVVQLESREWLAVIEGDQHWDWPVGMTIMSEVTALLTALGIDTTTSNREGK